MSTNTTFRIADVLSTVGGRLIHGDAETTFTNYCIDSRYVSGRTLFVPLMGQTRDGHQYVIDAISKGAVAALVRAGHHQVHEIISWIRDRSSHGGYGGHADLESVCIIEVRHTLVALQKIGEWFRNQFDVQVIGITGSVGKTGTKETLIQLLSTRWPTVGTEKNFNNEIGVPLALSRITPRTKLVVVEMAMRARGEISLLSRIAHPDLSIITNTAGSHVGRLGSFDEVYKAKAEIADGMKPGGTIILNRGDNNVLSTIDELRVKERGGVAFDIRFFDSEAIYAAGGIPPFAPPTATEGAPPDLPAPDVWVEDVQMRGMDGAAFTLCAGEERRRIDLPLLGRGAVENLTAAASIALHLGMELKEITDAAPELLPAPQRMNLYHLRDELFLIDDCYNSSPASVRDTLELMLSIPRRYRKVLVLGDMLELGKYETLLHRQLAITALNLPFDRVYAVGPRMNAVNEVEGGENLELFYVEGHGGLETDEYAERASEGRFGAPPNGRPGGRGEEMVILDDKAAVKLSALILNHLQQAEEPTVVLVKGSRALHLERIVNDLLSGVTNE